MTKHIKKIIKTYEKDIEMLTKINNILVSDKSKKKKQKSIDEMLDECRKKGRANSEN